MGLVFTVMLRTGKTTRQKMIGGDWNWTNNLGGFDLMAPTLPTLLTHICNTGIICCNTLFCTTALAAVACLGDRASQLGCTLFIMGQYGDRIGVISLYMWLNWPPFSLHRVLVLSRLFLRHKIYALAIHPVLPKYVITWAISLVEHRSTEKCEENPARVG